MLTFAATATLFATAILPTPLSLSPSRADLITSGPLALTWTTPRPPTRRWNTRWGQQEESRGVGTGIDGLRPNAIIFAALTLLASVSAILFYAPVFFLQKLVQYIQDDPERVDGWWGRERDSPHSGRAAVEQATTTLQVRMKMQLNSVLFVRKDVASFAGANDEDKDGDSKDKSKSKAKLDEGKEEDKEEEEFTSRAQVMTLMHVFAAINSAIEIIDTLYLSRLLGPSSLYGLLITLIALPSNHIAGKIVVGCQEGLMKRRDKRVGLMDEVLGGIRMVKFMGWERKDLTPAIAFTSIAIFSELKYAPNALFINILQSPVSLRRIETYLDSAEIAPVPKEPVLDPAMQGATVTWAQDRATSSSTSPRATTPAASTSGSPTPTAGAPTPTTPLPRHRARGISSTSRMSRCAYRPGSSVSCAGSSGSARRCYYSRCLAM
ncbi:hypothetical protein FIBSPDRAFT_930781 [Athelia psychrophila]|uniref:ABC transmembrane type-1 domain-containing protein n=1 Tax=Athelia psychrophila TaxID=1759441 RepID=A0A166LKS7_9AGAM|nr:hypothetical protein FIBSPDRAFT_930781 [Fibularhizoctonia sp. CBS 109695]